MTADRDTWGAGSDPRDCAPYYAAERPADYHTRLDCPIGREVPLSSRRIDHERLVERLPFW